VSAGADVEGFLTDEPVSVQKKAPEKKQVEPKSKPKAKAEDKKTEARYNNNRFCPDGKCGDKKDSPAKSAEDTYKASIDSTVAGGSCTDRILKSMRREANCWSTHGASGCGVLPARGKHRRGPFKGSCGRAVASGLTRAGINNGSTMNNAKDMGGPLRALGFVNLKTTSPNLTPETAPVGSILVYGPARRRNCRGLGSIYGHVEVKDYGGRYIYDGNASHNIQDRFGASCRPLIGVYVPTNVKGC
jgi:hypothetical protein